MTLFLWPLCFPAPMACGGKGKMSTVGEIVQKFGAYKGVFLGTPPTVIHGFQPSTSYYDVRLMNDAPP
jgi:hypothetical protein